MRIKLFLQDGVWMTDTLQPDRDEVLDLFGTSVLPTPFTKELPRERVQAELEALGNTVVEW